MGERNEGDLFELLECVCCSLQCEPRLSGGSRADERQQADAAVTLEECGELVQLRPAADERRRLHGQIRRQGPEGLQGWELAFGPRHGQLKQPFGP